MNPYKTQKTSIAHAFVFILILSFFPSFSIAQETEEVPFHKALKVKKNLYRSASAVMGGNSKINRFFVKSFRVGSHAQEYDRIVIETTPAMEGSFSQSPSFHVEHTEKNSAFVTLYGQAKLEFNARAIPGLVKKSRLIQQVSFLPIIDADRWMLSVELAPGTKMEVFELQDPARIIIDFKK